MPEIGEIKTNKQLHPNRAYKARGTLYLKYQWTACADCGQCRWVKIIQGTPVSPRCMSCASSVRQLGKIRNGKGRYIAQGYIWVRLDSQDAYFAVTSRKTNNTGWVQEHRLIIAQSIGRSLKPNELVHHLNGIKTDNRLENLLIVSPKTHANLIPVLEARIRELEAKVDGIGKKRAELCFQHFSRQASEAKDERQD